MITDARKAELKKLGYEVEDMQKANGPGWWNGSWRFLRAEDVGGDIGSPQSSEALAWEDCDQYQAQLDAMRVHGEIA